MLLKRHPSSTHTTTTTTTAKKLSRPTLILLCLTLFLLTSATSYEFFPASRHLAQAIYRCSRLMFAVVLDAMDYKRTFASSFDTDDEKQEAYKGCHLRSAKRMLAALEALGGCYIKIGQHLASSNVVPVEWSSTLSVLQDRCPVSPTDELERMILKDTGKPRDLFFSDWQPIPIGTASIAQVHLATDRESGKRVAVKLQHPGLEEFLTVDMATVNFAVKWIDAIFPDFQLSWLAREMNDALPLEMDFRVEAKNAQRTIQDFEHISRSALYIPRVEWCEKRILVMEYIDGARVDNLEYLRKHHIDRNQVAKELSRIFSQMIYLNGFFHADPHEGNVLIRPRPSLSKSPYNFEVVLLDHGQYFDMDDELRVNYAKFWLGLMAANTPATQALRRKYALRMGVDSDLYPILESAITGRVGMGAPSEEIEFDPNAVDEDGRPALMRQKAGSLLEMRSASEIEMDHMRNAVVQREGLLANIFKMLRSVPRRIIMVLKVNDLTRSLDKSLATTHDATRIFLESPFPINTSHSLLLEPNSAPEQSGITIKLSSPNVFGEIWADGIAWTKGIWGSNRVQIV
ncbi:Predicted unusual protein kinase [Phaffia rhodozyma]|uniref:Predicted unusual protein kinase n=1 Tax=Phaffia rhodozyma TaxID=264483 RepID=A0A0F7SFY3_PHARH|nr:Predicted unusual protein kinase [Phaffia rhodozyma]